jgi:succinate dehydrogenase / fumarate reductase, cytochrome b subunit
LTSLLSQPDNKKFFYRPRTHKERFVASAASSTAPGVKQDVKEAARHGVAPLRAGQGTSFVLRRLHSLSGIVPVGAFLFEHVLISNSTAISGPDAYARQVSFLGNLPLVFFLELFGIWLPIAFHALYGFYIWYRGEGNTIEYPWTGNWMYTAQRWTGGIAFLYIIWHTWTMRFSGIDLHAYPNASFGKVQAELMNPALLAFYIVGLIAASWHFAYGIWLFAAKWGITSGEKARQRFLAVCLGLFAFMTVVGLVSLYTFRAKFPQQTEPGTSAMQSSHASGTYRKPVE